MADITVSRPCAGHPEFHDLDSAFDGTIATIREIRDRQIRTLEEARATIHALSPDLEIPSSIAIIGREVGKVISEVFAGFDDQSAWPAAMRRLDDLMAFADGYFTLNEHGVLVNAEDYAAQLLQTRIAAIDWTREAANKDESELRRRVIDQTCEENDSPDMQSLALRALCQDYFATPASDLAKAIKRANKLADDLDHRESAERQRRLAFSLARKLGQAVAGVTA